MTTMSSATIVPPEPAPPEAIHNCPVCSHWLPEGTLVCPDCQTLTYGVHLSRLASQAQQMEHQQQWVEAREMWRSALQWLPAETQQATSVEEHIRQIDARLKAADDQKAKWTKRLGPFAPVVLFLLKIKSFLFLALKAKFIFGLLGFFAIYWAIYGWQFAIGFTVCLFLHELGHYVAVRRRGLKADLPMFFPGFGAYVRWYSQGVSREDLAAISLAGPLYGVTAALACLALYWGTHLGIFIVLTYVGAWVNFLNLLPILGLDGAQATYALSKMQRAMLAGTCIVFFALTVQGGDFTGAGVLWIFLIVGLGMLWRVFTADLPEEPSTRIFLYFQGLILVLGVICYKTQFMGMVR